MDTIRTQLKKHAVVVQLVLICIAGASLSIDNFHQLVDYDEATYAKVVVDTLHTDQVVNLYHFDQPWFEKPPLYPWLAMGSVTLFGEHAFAFRLPSIVAGILCCWLVYLLIAELTGDTIAAALGFLILLSSSPFLLFARQVRLDSSVLAAILAALYFFIKSWRSERFLFLVLPAIAVGFLFKSVIALLAIPTILLYAWVYDKWAFLRNRYFWWGALTSLVIWAPWHIAETLQFGQAFWADYMGRHVFARAFSTLTGMDGAWDYLPVIVSMNPVWSITLAIILVSICILAWKQRRSQAFALLPILLPFFIAIGVVALFTAAKTHLAAYVLPAFPFLALSIALGVNEVMKRLKNTQIMRVFVEPGIAIVLFLSVIIGFYVCAMFVSPKDDQMVGFAYDERAIGELYRAEHMPQVPLYIYNWRILETLDYYGDTQVTTLMPDDVHGQTLHGPFFLALDSRDIPYLFDGSGTPRFAGIKLMPNLNTTFRELVDLKKELAKFMPAWHYALGGRGAF
jgi:4-amino-4-deoxy-L-arabinose transferase-like glycosyltransferase